MNFCFPNSLSLKESTKELTLVHVLLHEETTLSILNFLRHRWKCASFINIRNSFRDKTNFLKDQKTNIIHKPESCTVIQIEKEFSTINFQLKGLRWAKLTLWQFTWIQGLQVEESLFLKWDMLGSLTFTEF